LYFVVNIALGDIILNLVSFPVGGLMYTVEGWPYGAAFCKIAHFLITLTLGMYQYIYQLVLKYLLLYKTTKVL